MLNTPENRAAFVERFGPGEHPNGPWKVDTVCAGIILGALDRDPDRYFVPKNLWEFIMQNRDTFMVGEQHFVPFYKKGQRVTEKKYLSVQIQVLGDIYDWLKELPEYRDGTRRLTHG